MGFQDHIGLPALQPLPCLSRSCVSREGHGHLVYQYIRNPDDSAERWH